MASPTHPDIVEFMTLYEGIQAATKGLPDRISFLYKNDPKFAELCNRINHRVFVLNLVKDSGDTVLENVRPLACPVPTQARPPMRS